MAFVDKIRNLLRYFLATQSGKYITTESGLKLQISDLAPTDKGRNATAYSDKNKTVIN